MPADTLVVAAAQTEPEPGDIAGNARRAATLVVSSAAAGARLVLFPELSLLSYDLALVADPAVWVTEEDVRLDALRDACREHEVTTVVGAACRQRDGGRLLASLVLSPDGRVDVVGKRNLHGAERQLFQPGGPGRLLDIDGWRVALAVCYDAGVPGDAQDAADRGAEIYAVSALYTEDERRRLDVHLAARAMDHRMYAMVANFAGSGPGWRSCGGSGVWHPDGRRLDHAGTGPDVVVAHLSHGELRTLRDKDALAGYPHGR